MENPLQVVRPAPDKDTVETLQGLLEAAREGRLTGFAYVAIYRGDDFSGDLLGRAKDNPYQTIGLLKALQVKITPYL